MKTTYLYLILALISLLTLAGCESGGKFRVINRTSHNVYVTIEGQNEVLIPGSDTANEVYNEHIFNIDTENQSILTGTVKERVQAVIYGETFHMFNKDVNAFTDSTTLTINAGKTLNAFLSPNRASIKIINNSTKNITMAEVFKHNFTSDLKVGQLTNITSGSEDFLRVDFATPSASFYYYVVITLEDGTQYTYGDSQNILSVDSQFLILLEDPV